MKNSIKGALLSGVVFPGLGQVILKQYKRGIALMLIALVNMLLIIVKAVQQAFIILNKIELEGGVINGRGEGVVQKYHFIRAWDCEEK